MMNKNSMPNFYRGVARMLLFVMLIQLSGCSLFVSSRQSITVASDPSGAEILINGENFGASPATGTIRRDEPASIMVRKKGYETVTRSTSTRLSGWGIVDIIGGVIWLVPFFGLLGAGAWKQEPTNISVALPEKESASALPVAAESLPPKTTSNSVVLE